MTNLTQNFVNPNNQPLVIGEFSIRQDDEGRYCLNDLHKASGDQRKDRPSYFIENEKTQELIGVIEDEYYDVGNPTSCKKAINIIRGKGREQGTYAVKELIYSYAMWISAKFHLTVIRAYDAMVMQWKINDRQTISPEQKDTLQKIVDHKVDGNNGLRAQVWTRHNRHFKINSYHELLAIHFEDAVKYLLEMEVKAKQEVKLIAMQPYEDKNVQFLMWYVPILAKYVKNEIYPALQTIQSAYAGQLIGLTHEIVGYANLLNRRAIEGGMTNLNHVGNQPVHTIHWYLEK
ncbi:KilA-N domain-containing protein [Acinetobacter sp. SAAs470]|nr:MULTISPECIES: KilA-N domain-containing protein [unclassified Acinetobacter]WOE33099.1 KilA-N domain-containing protein [Acinetobacter sp. SAAs470]WOE38219.1 KilA-N domain-containing protein [Acinetobacter sp. SAAs474]